MAQLTTNDLIDILKEQDPEGNRVIFLRIESDEYSDYVASGDIDAIEINVALKDGYQTSEGDKNILRITLPLNVDLDIG